MIIKSLYQTRWSRSQEFIPIESCPHTTITVSQFNLGEGWKDTTLSYPSTLLTPEQVLEFAKALTAAAELAIEWSNNPPQNS
jgi:hypothetical protein